MKKHDINKNIAPKLLLLKLIGIYSMIKKFFQTFKKQINSISIFENKININKIITYSIKTYGTKSFMNRDAKYQNNLLTNYAII